MPQFPRGIAPELLLSQIRNTMPYLFAETPAAAPLAAFPPAALARDAAARLARPEPLSHFEYFRLCLSAHYLTCATPVPTDVDNQIRLKLWPARLPLETALEMAALVLESRRWDFAAVTARTAPAADYPLSGHLGEWFTVAAAAYAALSLSPEPAARAGREALRTAIGDEVRHHSEAFGALWRAGEGLACLRASAALAHNFGDLDRVMDMWDLPVGDPLRLECYGLGTRPFDADGKLRHLGRLWTAGELYKAPIDGSAMALENHRHFALRKPRGLRESRAYLVPTGPFFDDWGRAVAGLGEEVVEALLHGLDRLPKTAGYGRALHGIAEARPELTDACGPRRDGRSRAAFERVWAEGALAHLEDIPSRA